MSESFTIQASVLEIKRFFLKRESSDHRIVKDYELDYYLSGSRKKTINGQEYDITGGTMVMRKPGDDVTSEGNYDGFFLTLNFDSGLSIPPEEYRRDRITRQQTLSDHPLLRNIPPVFHPIHKQEYEHIYEKLCMVSYPMSENRKAQELLLTQLFFLLNADLCAGQYLETAQLSPAVQKGFQYINTNYSKKITLRALADISNLSPNYFLKCFREEIGSTPKEYLIQIRLENARSMLSATPCDIATVAEECGFTDAAYFCRIFKQRYGKTPSEYRKNP